MLFEQENAWFIVHWAWRCTERSRSGSRSVVTPSAVEGSQVALQTGC